MKTTVTLEFSTAEEAAQFLARVPAPAPSVPHQSPPMDHLRDVIYYHQMSGTTRLRTIKAIRDFSGCTLQKAKDIVDKYWYDK